MPSKGSPTARASSTFPNYAAIREQTEGAKSLRGMSLLRRAQPVTSVERAAHAQRHRGDIDKLFGRHFFGGIRADFNALDTLLGAGSLVRPFCLADGCRTGYRKE